MTTQKGRIFISYRRADSAGYAGRIYDRLATHFREEAIFMDVNKIPAGTDFAEVLEKEFESCDVLIALINRQWLHIKDEAGNRRLDNPQDYVRTEIAAALRRRIRVIPVLFDGTPMPRRDDLPHGLKRLAHRNAVFVQHRDFHPNIDYLIKQLELALEAAEESRILKTRELEEKKAEKKRQAEVANLMAQADIAIQLKGWKLAKEKLEKLLEIAPEDTQAQVKLEFVEGKLANVKEKFREESSQERILEAAIEKQVVVNRSTELFVYIRTINSESIVSIVKKRIDEETFLDEESIKARDVIIDFPIENEKLLPAKAQLKCTARDFYPEEDVKTIEIPPDGNAGPFSFNIVPKKAGLLRISLELIQEKTSRATKTIRTTAIETQKEINTSLVVISMPVIVRESPSISIDGNLQGSIVIGNNNTIDVDQKSLPKATKRKACEKAERGAEEEKAPQEAKKKAEREVTEEKARLEAEAKAAQEAVEQEKAKRATKEKAERETAIKATEEKARQKVKKKVAKKAAEKKKAELLAKEKVHNVSLSTKQRFKILFTKLSNVRIPKKALGILIIISIVFFSAWFVINAPKGETVYFISTRAGNSEVYKLDNKGRITQMTTSPSGSRVWDAAIASNGNLYFTSNRSGKREIYRLDAEGKVTQMTFSPNDSISWEPTTAINDKLFFTSNRSGKNEIYSVDENGEIVQMTDSPGTSTSKNPEISLSGKLYFTSDRSGKNEIYSIDENGKIVQMTKSPGTSKSEAPSLSLSGKLYFVSNRSGKTEIYSLDENKKVVQMTFSPSTSASKNPIPSISGRLYFTSDRSERDEVYYLDESGEIVQITFNSGSMLADVR